MTTKTSRFFSQDESGIWYGVANVPWETTAGGVFTNTNMPHNQPTAVKATAEEARHCAVAMLVEPGGHTPWGYRWHSLPIIASRGKVER